MQESVDRERIEGVTEKIGRRRGRDGESLFRRSRFTERGETLSMATTPSICISEVHIRGRERERELIERVDRKS